MSPEQLTHLQQLSPDEVIDAVMPPIWEAIDAASTPAEGLRTLTRPEQVLYLALTLEHQVLNGGFHQFLWNMDDDVVQLTGPALRDLGADRVADLLADVLVAADEHLSAQPASTPQPSSEALTEEEIHRRILEAFSKSAKSAPFDKFDATFVDLADDLPVLRMSWLRTHAESFEVRGLTA